MRAATDYIHARNGACEVLEAMDVKPFTDRKDTIVEPDILVVCDPKKLTERRVEGAPDWIIEITSPGNPQNDYLRKLDIYYRAGVKEYWIVDPEKETVFVYYFADKQFSLTSYHFTDKIPSQLYEGFTICPAELLGE